MARRKNHRNRTQAQNASVRLPPVPPTEDADWAAAEQRHYEEERDRGDLMGQYFKERGVSVRVTEGLEIPTLNPDGSEGPPRPAANAGPEGDTGEGDDEENEDDDEEPPA